MRPNTANHRFKHNQLRLLMWASAGVALLLCSGYAPANAEEAAAKYPFRQPPHAILKNLAGANLGEPPVIGNDELQALAAAWKMQNAGDEAKKSPAYDQLVVDTLLTASGATTAADRTKFRDQLKTIIADARLAVKNRQADVHPGEALMQFLHAGVLRGGYVEDQTSFAEVFASNEYNCVSSTAMYYVVGRELGFEMRIISIPGNLYLSGHACLDLIEGSHTYQVEPTNPDGFDWETKMNKPGVFTIGFQPDRKDGHVVDGLGLAATIYANRGITAVNVKQPQQPDHLAAASLGLRALLCDPNDSSTANNVKAVFANWGPALAKQGRFDEGVRALAFGLAATNDGDVKNNFVVISSERIEDLLTKGKDREAQAAIEQARAVLPDESTLQNAAPWIHYADQCYSEQSPAESLAVVQRGLKLVPPTDQTELREFRSSLIRRHSQNLLAKKDCAGSLEILALGQQLNPEDTEVLAGVGFHVYEALQILDQDGAHPAAAIEHQRLVLATFPDCKAATEFGLAHAQRSLNKLCAAGKFQPALLAAKDYAPLARSKAESQDLLVQVWESWGEQLAGQKQWQAAVDKYMEGLQQLPNNERLLNGALRTFDNWADISQQAGEWDQALAIYDRGLKAFPNNGHLQNNRNYTAEKKAEALQK